MGHCGARPSAFYYNLQDLRKNKHKDYEKCFETTEDEMKAYQLRCMSYHAYNIMKTVVQEYRKLHCNTNIQWIWREIWTPPYFYILPVTKSKMMHWEKEDQFGIIFLSKFQIYIYQRKIRHWTKVWRYHIISTTTLHIHFGIKIYKIWILLFLQNV